MLYARFTEDGIPAWIGDVQAEGCEELPDSVLVGDVAVEVDLLFLASHMRTAEGHWIERPPEPPPTSAERAAQAAAGLQAAKDQGALAIDELVSKARLRFVTQLPGQEAIYLAKEAEARLYVATVPEPDSLEDFPYLAAEVGITAGSARDLAQIWLQRGALFRGLGAATENRRMTARKALAAAPSSAAVIEILNGLSADLDALG